MPDSSLRHRVPSTAPLRHPVTWLAVMCYIPAFFQSPGRVSADTKTYLYLDPWGLMSEAWKAWDPSTGAGMVTHQKIGYLWPMGPWYLLMDLLQFPDWVAQRLWWGTVLFLAGLGTYALARRLGFSAQSSFTASVLYAFSPYVFEYLARLSGLLLPWAGLPWLILTAVRARQSRSWRWPIATGLIVATIGSLNATTLFMAMLGWLVWVLADALTGESSTGSSLRYLFKSGVAIIAFNLWWLGALVVQGSYGVPILRYTEAYEIIAASSTPLEVLRGLGYWFFYGGEPREPWIGPASDYLQNRIVLATTFAGVVIGLVAVALYRGRARLNLALLFIVGLGVAVGSTPWDSPSLYGRTFRAFVESDVGGALRSTPRAAPLVILALALAVGWASGRLRENAASGIHARRSTVLGRLAVPAVVALQAINFFPWFTGGALTDWITRDENVPSYWRDAAEAIDATTDTTTGFARTYEFPGIPFASYTWGGTIDPITPGLVDSDVVAREQVPIGSEPTMDLLTAMESRLQENRLDDGMLSDFARLISATAVDWRADLRFLDYSTPQPAQMARSLERLITGGVREFGRRTALEEDEYIADRRYYVRPRADSHPAVSVWEVETPRALVSAAALDRMTIVAGNGQGVLDAMAVDLLDPLSTFVYEASRRFLGSDEFLANPAHFVITDSNRRAARSWASVSRTEGRTEQATEEAPPSRLDSRLMPFVDDPSRKPLPDEQSVSELRGPVRRTVTNMYGSEFGWLPEHRAENLVDGDLDTAWRTGGQGGAVGKWASIVYSEDQTVSALTVYAARGGRTGRPVTEARVTLRGADGSVVRRIEFEPDGRSFTVLKFPETTFRTLRIEILRDKWTDDGLYINQPTTGFAEVILGDAESEPDAEADSAVPAPTSEWIRMPISSPDLQASASRLSLVATRWRSDADDMERSDPEPVLRRVFVLASPRTVGGGGEVRPSARDDRSGSDRLVDIHANESLPSTARSSASRAFDGDLNTSWVSPLPLTRLPEFDARLDSPAVSSGERETLTLVVRGGPRHSIPTAVTVTDSRGDRWRLDLVAGPGDPGTTVTSVDEREQSLSLVAELPRRFALPVENVRISGVARTLQQDSLSPRAVTVPLEIIEVFLGAEPTAGPDLGDGVCRDDLVRVDSLPVAIRLAVDPTVPLMDGPHRFVLCAPLTLAAGEHTIEGTDGATTGLDVDRVWLDTGPLEAPVENAAANDEARVSVEAYDGRSISVSVTVSRPTLLAFAQSASRGWKATLVTERAEVDLGGSFVVNGYANGWIVPETGRVEIAWTPQRTVDLSLVISSVAIALAVGWLILDRRRSGRRGSDAADYSSRMPMRNAGLWTRVLMTALVLSFGGPVAALVFVAALIAPTKRVVVFAGAVPLVGGVVIIWLQGRYGYPTTVAWPTRFEPLIPWTWAAVASAVGALLSPGSDRETSPEPRG